MAYGIVGPGGRRLKDDWQGAPAPVPGEAATGPGPARTGWGPAPAPTTAGSRGHALCPGPRGSDRPSKGRWKVRAGGLKVG